MGFANFQGQGRNSVLIFEMDTQLKHTYLNVKLQSSYWIMIFNNIITLGISSLTNKNAAHLFFRR